MSGFAVGGYENGFGVLFDRPVADVGVNAHSKSILALPITGEAGIVVRSLERFQPSGGLFLKSMGIDRFSGRHGTYVYIQEPRTSLERGNG